MGEQAFEKILREALQSWRAQGLDRKRRALRPIDSVHVEIDGKRFVNFSSNDYLGLSHHPRVIEAVVEGTKRYGAGSGASGLVSGYTEAHARAEAALARWKGTESAVLLASGYQANLAAVQTIAAVNEGRVRFLMDKLVHASLVDAVRGVGADSFRVFAHNDLAKVKRLIESADPEERQVIVTESVFSMDGDFSDLAALAQLDAVLLVDEAHGSGVYGPDGSGYAAEVGVSGDVDVFIVTCSKAMGLVGGAICGAKAFCEALVNFGRAYIYSTAIPAGIAMGIEASIDVMRDEPDRQRRVREIAQRFREGASLGGGGSAIVPLILGEEARAMELAERLFAEGFLVTAVRPPTVARGTSRLRITLSCEHSDADVERLVAALRRATGSDR